ncbi:dynein heavy chain 11, axonemal [Pipra filicauda]|uniref:Dynein heavy chain 11, axonemal n=1 Tax=Pipra filicauda TaxID=649802 RepID=A0A7R5L7M7_9PASS|nr:dynein heavy chain 11, axonemal [Pipra filicauda]
MKKPSTSFPCFYFVFSADLLDILSKGTQPKQVESWLQYLEETAHKLVRLCIMEAILAYEEKQREQYDRQKLTTKEIHSCQYVAHMNPTAGSFTIKPRLQVGLASLYIKTGAKNMPTVFLLTDAQVPDERFFVLINGLLASGELPDLFGDEGLKVIVAGVRKSLSPGPDGHQRALLEHGVRRDCLVIGCQQKMPLL